MPAYHMINLIHAHQPRRQLKHVVPQGNDDELGVLGAFFDVGGYDGDLDRGLLVGAHDESAATMA